MLRPWIVIASLALAATPAIAFDDLLLWEPASAVRVTGAITTPDGGAHVFGFVRPGPYVNKSFLAHFDASGEVVSSVTLGDQTSNSREMVRTTNGDLVTLEPTGTGATYRIIMTRRDDAGVVKWRRQLPSETTGVVTLCADSGGGCFLVDHWLDSVTTRDMSVISKVDSTGMVSWTVALDTDHVVKSVAPSSDGGVFAAGESSLGLPWLARLGPTGDLAWDRVCQGTPHRETGLVVVDADGTVLMTEWTGDGRPVVTRWSGSGGLLGGAVWSNGGTSSRPLPIKAAVLANGVVVMASSLANGAMACQVNPDLTPSGCEAYDLGATFEVAQASELPGGLIIAGTRRGSVDSGLVVHVDSGLVATSPCIISTPRAIASSMLSPSVRANPPVTLTPTTAILDAVPFPDRVLVPSVGSLVGDSRESDDVASSAGRICGGESQVHDFCDDAFDWLELEVDAGQSYELATSSLGPEADTVIELYAVDGSTLLGSDDDGGVPPASRLAFTAAASGGLKALIRTADASRGPNRDYTVTLTGDTTRLMRWSRNPVGGDLRSIADTARGVIAGTAADLQFLSHEGLPLEIESGPGFVGPARDGGYFASGKDSGTWIVRRRPDDSTAWSQGLSYTTRQFFTTLVEAANGDLLAGGADIPGGGIARFGLDGSLAWVRTFDIPIVTYHVAIAELSNGDIVHATATRSARQPVHVVRLTRDGNFIGAWTLTAPEPTKWVAGVMPTSDGGLMVAATAASPLDFALDGESWIAKLSSTMSVDWARHLGADVYAHIFGATLDPDGGMLAAGAATFGPDGRGDALLMSVDESGDVAWTTSVDTGYYYDRFWCVAIARDSSILAGGRGGPNSPDTSGWQSWAVRLGEFGELPESCVATKPAALEVTPETLTVAPAAIIADPFTITTLPASPVPPRSPLSGFDFCATGAVPAEVSSRLSQVLLTISDGVTLTWELPQPSGSDLFNVYRGSIARLRAGDYGNCLASRLAVNTLDDPAAPSPGDPWFYLVAGLNRFGEGPLTRTSARERRDSTAPCP